MQSKALERYTAPKAGATSAGKDSNGKKFHNPYNFVPALPRDGKVVDTGLGDRSPMGHHAYFPEHWSGSIAVKLTTKTPLLLHDASQMKVDQNGHKTLPMRLGVDGRPYIAPTSIKGMLRSAYEIVTNSRLSVFVGHEDCLAYRNPPAPSTKNKKEDKPDLIPAIVVRSKTTGKPLFQLLRYDKIADHTVKLYRYGDAKDAEGKAKFYEGTRTLPQHGEQVWVTHNNGGFATKIVHREGSNKPDGEGWKRGWAYITGENINGKKYERVFIDNSNHDVIEIQKEHHRIWQQLICNYQTTNKRAMEKRKNQGIPLDKHCGDKPGEVAFSRHIYQPGSETLKPGTLCYVVLDKDGDIASLAPVTISRQLYEISPDRLLDDSLRPATAMERLSPCDRVFGWVNQSGSGSYKGQLRISSVQCLSSNAIEELREPMPLAILSSPKPEQARFYIAEDRAGQPLGKGMPKAKGYSEKHSIRGRKVYPHHQNLDAKEWQRTGGVKDDQNCSIQSWVKPDSSFTFTLDVTNLSAVELGALLWMLDLQRQVGEAHYYRLGAGKPLGFGSVALEVDWGKTVLHQGQDLRDYYSSLTGSLTNSLTGDLSHSDALMNCIDAYKQAFHVAYGGSQQGGDSFEKITVIQAFCQAAQGFKDGLPIHYPRLEEAKSGDGKEDNPIFDWFVNNESISQSNPGLKLSLPALWNEIGLPYESRPGGNNGQQNGQRARTNRKK
jgi:CRISPR-associated protein (TIGR03986 family)